MKQVYRMHWQETVKPEMWTYLEMDRLILRSTWKKDMYVITSVKANQNYKNVKDQGEGIYRVTKITGPVTVTVATLLLWYRRKAA